MFKTDDKKEAEKFVRNVIKISIKIGVLQKSERFNKDEVYLLSNIQRKLRTIVMTLVSFHQVEHSYDRNFLLNTTAALKDKLKELVKTHLTEKSLSRIDFVFNFFSEIDFLDSLYVPGHNESTRTQMNVVVEALNVCIEEGTL